MAECGRIGVLEYWDFGRKYDRKIIEDARCFRKKEKVLKFHNA